MSVKQSTIKLNYWKSKTWGRGQKDIMNRKISLLAVFTSALITLSLNPAIAQTHPVRGGKIKPTVVKPVPVSSTTAKASNTPNPAPGPKDYSPHLMSETRYTIGVNAGPGVYVITQIGAATACKYILITSVDIGSGAMQKKRVYSGTTTVQDNLPGIDHGNLTVRLKNGDVFMPSCDAELYNGGIANIFYPGTYLVGVNILPGVYQSKFRSCSYTYSTPQTPINMNLTYGNNIHPTFFSGSAGPIVIPANANVVFFSYNCTALVRVGEA